MQLVVCVKPPANEPKEIVNRPGRKGGVGKKELDKARKPLGPKSKGKGPESRLPKQTTTGRNMCLTEIGLCTDRPSVWDACTPYAEEVLQARGLYLLRRRDYDPFLRAFQSMHLSNARDKSKEEVPPELFRGCDDGSPTQLGKTGFTAPRHLDDVSNDDKWAHLTQSKNHDACMISTDESRLIVQRMCRDRLAQGRHHGKVAVIATHRIRTPIRRALTEVLRFAELEHRPDAEKVLQRIGTEWWVYANISPHSITEILTYEEFLGDNHSSKERASPRQREEQRQLAEARALEKRIRAFNSPKRAQSATWAPEGTPVGKTGGDQPTNNNNKPGNRNTLPTIWQRAGLRGPPGDSSQHPPPSPSRKRQNMPGSTLASADTTTASTTTNPNDSTGIESILPSWERDYTQSLSLGYQSTQETIVWPSASEGSQDANGIKRRSRSKKNMPSGLRRTQRRKHLQRDTAEANPSEGANGGRRDEGTEKSVSNWPSYDKQNDEFNQMLSECPKGHSETGRKMGPTESQEQNVQMLKMRVHGEGHGETGVLGAKVYRTFPMTERSIYQAFLYLALFKMFSVEFYATILMLANFLGERPKLENGGRRILILFGTLLCLPKTQAAPFYLLDSKMAPPGWVTAAAAVVAAQTALTMYERWALTNPTWARVTPSYAASQKDQAENLEARLEQLRAIQTTSNNELMEGLTRYNTLVNPHNEMAEQANNNLEELSQRKKELTEAVETIEEYKKQVTGNMEEIMKAKEQLQQPQEIVDQLTEAVKEGNDSSQTIARLQEELRHSKRENKERMTQELIKFSEQLAKQTTNMMDVIKQILENMTINKGNKADKCGCTLNGKEPDKFDGKDPEKFLCWFTRVENYVGGQLHRIATAADVRIIMFSLLEENALEYAIECCPEGHLSPEVMGEDQETLKKAEYEGIVNWLMENFKDTLMTQKLVIEWEKCYQNDEKFQTWIFQYERIVKRAGLVAPGNQPSQIGACHDLWRRLKKPLRDHFAIK
ncbi:hypothetical protein BDD12DRAFT_802945 [Trichophaea hybrida]|nr:hypothetical protein BDD12DRAFT_802945 [Trichophaea hybrida]